MAPLYYRHANAALVVFDVTNYDTFSAVQRWIDGKSAGGVGGGGGGGGGIDLIRRTT